MGMRFKTFHFAIFLAALCPYLGFSQTSRDILPVAFYLPSLEHGSDRQEYCLKGLFNQKEPSNQQQLLFPGDLLFRHSIKVV